MMKKKIFLAGVLFAYFLAFSGCIVEKKTTTNSDEEEIVSYKNDMTTQALEHARQMQLAVIRAQDENAVLRARNDELTKQLEALEGGRDIKKSEIQEELSNPNDLEQQYKELLKKNEELRKLVQYERGLREDLMRRIDQDQITIKELKSRLGE